MNLHMTVREQLAAEVFATGCIEINGIGFYVDSRDATHLRMAVFINGAKRKNAYIAEFLDTSLCVHKQLVLVCLFPALWVWSIEILGISVGYGWTATAETKQFTLLAFLKLLVLAVLLHTRPVEDIM